MATINASTLAKQPKQVQQGDITKTVMISNTTDGTLPTGSNIYNLVGIPYGAIITAVKFNQFSDQTTFTLSLGIAGGTATTFGSAVAQSNTTTTTYTGLLPYVVTGADTDTQRYKTLYATVNASGPSSAWSLNVIVNYTMDS